MLSEVGVKRLVARVCSEIDPGVPPPRIIFGNGSRWDALYDPDLQQITIPSREWVKEHRATTARGYRLLVLHELSHHFFGSAHNEKFYSGLFGLCALYGVPLSFAYQDELEYKPRGAARGLDQHVKALQDKIDSAWGESDEGGRVVYRVQPRP